MLRRQPERKVRPPPPPPPPIQPIYEDFCPQPEWTDQPAQYILRFHLPQGFTKEDLNIMAEKSGKITIRGRKRAGLSSRIARLDLSQDLPKDSNLEQISGKIENGFLHLTIPKVLSAEPQADKKAGENQELKETPKEMEEKPMKPDLTTAERAADRGLSAGLDKREDGESVKEKPSGLDRTEMATPERIEDKAAEALKEVNENRMVDMKKTSGMNGDKRGDSIKGEEADGLGDKKAMEKEGRKITQQRIEDTAAEALEEVNENRKVEKNMTFLEEIKRPSGMNGDKRGDSIKREEAQEKKAMEKEGRKIKQQRIEDTAAEDLEEVSQNRIVEKKMAFLEEMKKPNGMNGDKRGDIIKREEAEEKKAMEKEGRKRRRLWSEEEKGLFDWLDGAYVDGVLKKVCRNKKYIAVAVLAFSTAFFISRKLRARG